MPKLKGCTEEAMRAQIMKYREVLRRDDKGLRDWIHYEWGDERHCPICLASECSNCAAVVDGVTCVHQDWFVELRQHIHPYDTRVAKVKNLVTYRLKYWTDLYRSTYKGRI